MITEFDLEEPIEELRVLETDGGWETEEESAAAFDRAVEGSGLFNMYREVTGYYLQPRMGQELKRPRIDRILSPTPEFAKRWRHGPIGIEIKASRVNAGPPISQMLDYSRAVWYLPIPGFRIMVTWIFLWPLEKVHGTVASILAQNKLGTAWETRRDRLMLYAGEQKILRVPRHGPVEFGDGSCGRHTGSR